MKQPPAEGDMDAMLTVEEIEARFAPDWASSLSRRPTMSKGPWRAAVAPVRIMTRSIAGPELRLDRIAVRYLGTWPEDTVLILRAIIEYWQRQGDAAIYRAAWELVELYHRGQGMELDELRLQRSLEHFERS